MNQLTRITNARVVVICRAPFFGSLLMRLAIVADPAAQTFCTDGVEIRFNEDYCARLSDAELRFVLVHEVCHCALGHLWRMGARDPKKWNLATDYAVNQTLEDYAADLKLADPKAVDHWVIPQGMYLDPQYRGMASEEIYAKLPDPKPGEEPPPPSPGEFSAPAQPKPSPQPVAQNLEQEWQLAVTQAATVAKMQGKLPGSLARLVGEMLEPRVPWRQVLREFIRQQARDDFSWSRPNRRYAGTGVILPSLHSERMGRIVVGVDTSMSIGDKELAEFQAECQGALDECSPEAMEVVYCDARVQGSEEFLPGDTARFSRKQCLGGGGTDFAPVFAHVERHEQEPAALIYLTDGLGSFPPAAPDYPVLWASTQRKDFPFGQVVAVK